MAGPWERYQQQSEHGPWEKYSEPAPSYLDREIPLSDHWAATESGAQSIGRGLRDAVVGAWKGASAKPEGTLETIGNIVAPGIGVPAIRAVKGLAPLTQAGAVPEAIHDINQSDDPVGTYAKAAQETAGQGAGQALTALAAHGVGEGAEPVARITKPIVKAVAGGVRDVATPENIGTAVGGAAGYHFGNYAGGALGGAAGRVLGKAIGKRWAIGAEPVYPGAPYPLAPPIIPAAEPIAPLIPRSLQPGQYEAPPSPIQPPKQLGSGVIEGEYVDSAPPPIKPAIGNLPAGVYEARGGFEPTQTALPAKPAIPLPEAFSSAKVGSTQGAAADTDFVKMARSQLGADAPISDVIDRAQDLKMGRVPAAVAAPETEGVPPIKPVRGETIPRTLSGESALRQVLTGQDNANLLKIAKSRGINVAKEAQLKAGVGDPLLIGKIIDDFDADELSNVRDTFLESHRNRAQFGDIGPEAWKTMSLQTYFPDLKIPAAVMNRTRSAIDAARIAVPTAEDTPPAIVGKKPPVAADEDLTEKLKQSVKQAKAKRGKR